MRLVERLVPEQALAERGMTGQRGENVVGHPALAPDYDEAGILGVEPIEGLKQKRVVLARLDRPHGEQEAEPGQGGEGRGEGLVGLCGAGLGQVGAELDDAGGNGAAEEALGKRTEVAVDAGRGGERIVGILDLVGDRVGKGNQGVRRKQPRQQEGNDVVVRARRR